MKNDVGTCDALQLCISKVRGIDQNEHEQQPTLNYSHTVTGKDGKNTFVKVKGFSQRKPGLEICFFCPC